MSRSLIAAVLLLAPLAVLASCASADEKRAAAAAAHTCHMQFPAPAQEAQYDACVAQMESNIRDARAYHSQPEQPAHGRRPSGGGGH